MNLRPVGAEFEHITPPSRNILPPEWAVITFRVTAHVEVFIGGRTVWAEEVTTVKRYTIPAILVRDEALRQDVFKPLSEVVMEVRIDS